MAETDGEPKTKGMVFRGVMQAIGERKGEPFRREVESALPEPFGESWRTGAVVASGWYPMRWYREMWETIRDRDPDPQLVRDIGRITAERELGTIHRLLMRMVSPTTLIQVSQRLLSRYFTHGTLELVERGPGMLRARWSGFEGFDGTLWMENLAGAELIVEMSGAEDVRLTRLSGGRDGDTEMIAEARWR